MELFAFGQCVANLEYAVVGQTYDIARPGLVDGFFPLGHELGGAGEPYGLACPHVEIGRVADETSGAYFAESDTRTVVGVDIGCNLEDETRELIFFRRYGALFCHRGAREGGNLYKTVEHLLYTKVVECGTEEYGSDFGIEVGVYVEFRVYAFHQFQVFTQFFCVGLSYMFVELLAVDVYLHFFCHLLLVGRKEIEVVLKYIVHALEAHALVDGPAQRAHLNLELLFQFVQ